MLHCFRVNKKDAVRSSSRLSGIQINLIFIMFIRFAAFSKGRNFLMNVPRKQIASRITDRPCVNIIESLIPEMNIN